MIDEKKRVLAVSDESLTHDLLGFLLSEYCEMEFARNPKEAIQCISKGHFDTIIVYHSPPNLNGIPLLNETFRRFPLVRRVLIGNDASTKFSDHLHTGLIQKYLRRPTTVEEILSCLKD